MSLRDYLAQISIPVYVIVSLFAISSWIDINGLFVESPQLVYALPEGWSLFSYLAVLIQVANLGPILYMILRKLFPERVKEWPIVYAIIGMGATACFLLAFFWQETTVINGKSHSTALFVLVSFLALVDCTSSVVYLPYMGQYKPQYMTAFYIGEGLSGMIPGFLGLIQGVQSDPRCLNKTVVKTNEMTGENTTVHRIMAEYPPPLFSVQVFFFFLFAMLLLSGVSFTLLHFHPFCKKELVASVYSYNLPDVGVKRSEEKNGRTEESSKRSRLALTTLSSDDYKLTSPYREPENGTTSMNGKNEKRFKLSTAQFVYVLFLAGLLNALLNGVLPSTNSYTCLPYGSLAFTLAIRLSAVANPLTCFFALFMRTKSLIVVGIVALFATGLSAWQLYLAVMSPYPPLKNTVAGTALVITSHVLNTICIIHVNVSNAFIMNAHGGRHSLLWLGGATQIGSCIGAIVTFVFVNVLRVFHSEPPCPGMSY
ncbi:hypothetical protein LSH36_1190g00096 [Paralvinella palmiformis]|uniref:Riboflavin transporter n=1 Tax=Paralvinella palmiformis TaxID=53620 RepID=A0AAD9IV88_9ANNE|nr:hypothetical protein LSH36_1190g00096 [Paralvinella palmiformis]